VNAGQAPILDNDGDGLPDAEDADSDGYANGFEYAAGTDPRDRNSFFHAVAVSGSGGIEISFGAVAGRSYAVQFCTTLGAAWTNLPGAENITPATAQTITVTDPAAVPQRFYRVITPAQP
jgi:hypothetical protein